MRGCNRFVANPFLFLFFFFLCQPIVYAQEVEQVLQQDKKTTTLSEAPVETDVDLDSFQEDSKKKT